MDKKLEEEGFTWSKKNRKSIVRDILSKYDNDKYKAKQIIFLSGSPGAGKTEFINDILEQGYKDYFLHIDLDDLRTMIPGYKGDEADSFQKGAIRIMEMLLDKSFKNHLNIILDGTFGSKTATNRNIKKAIKKGYNIKIYYIKFDPILAWKYTLGREVEKERKVPFWSFFNQYYNSFDNIKKIVKNNEGIELIVLNKLLTKTGHSAKIYTIHSYKEFKEKELNIKPIGNKVKILYELCKLTIKYRFFIKKGLINYNNDYEQNNKGNK